MLGVIPQIFLASFKSPDIIILAICQTPITVARDSFLLRLTTLCAGSVPVVIPLHGNVFSQWTSDEPVSNRFHKVLRQANAVTVLGPSQKSLLINPGGLAESSIVVLPNTCEFPAISTEKLRKKHGAERLEILHLSSLMEPKGYPKIVESMFDVQDLHVGLTLCGRLVQTAWDTRFESLDEAKEWLNRKADALDGRMRLIQGAHGEFKADLFSQSQVFVFPSSYPVETQPIVLLEAMASGCTIVTSRIGEIEFLLDNNSCLFLEECTTDAISDSIRKIERNRKWAMTLGYNARDRYLNLFDANAHADNWRKLLTRVQAKR